MNEIRRMFPDEVAAALNAKDKEINKLRKKLERVRGFVDTYPGDAWSKCQELKIGVLDIIDNGYEEDE